MLTIGMAEKTKIAPNNASHQPRSSRAHHSARLGSSRFAPVFEIALGWATARHHRVITCNGGRPVPLATPFASFDIMSIGSPRDQRHDAGADAIVSEPRASTFQPGS